MQGKRPIVTWEGNKRRAKLLAAALRDVLVEWEKDSYSLRENPESSLVWVTASNLLSETRELLTDIASEMPCPYDGVPYSEVPGWAGGEYCTVCYSEGDSHGYVEKGADWGGVHYAHKDHKPLKRARRIVEKSRIAWLEPDTRINRGRSFLEIYLRVGILPNLGRRGEKTGLHTFVMRSVFSLQMFEDTQVPDEFLVDKIEKDVEKAGLGVLLLEEAPPVSFDFREGQDDAKSVRSR